MTGIWNTGRILKGNFAYMTIYCINDCNYHMLHQKIGKTFSIKIRILVSKSNLFKSSFGTKTMFAKSWGKKKKKIQKSCGIFLSSIQKNISTSQKYFEYLFFYNNFDWNFIYLLQRFSLILILIDKLSNTRY